MQPSDAGSHAVAGRDPHKPTILGKFLVKPSEAFHFVEAAELITKAVSEQEGSLVYGFSKTLLVNSLGPVSLTSLAVFGASGCGWPCLDPCRCFCMG